MKRRTIFNLARQNLRRRGNSRNLLIVLTVLLAIGTLFTSLMLYESVGRGIRTKVESLGADLIVMPQSIVNDAREILTGQIDIMRASGLTDDFLHLNTLSKVARVKGVQQVSPILFFAIWGEEGGGACCGKFTNVYLLGFDPKSDFTVKRLSKNKYAVQEPFADDEMFIGYYHSFPMEDYTVTRIGQVYGYMQKAIGMLKKTGTGLDWSFFLPLNGIYAMTQADFPAIISAETAKRLSKITKGKVSIFLIKVGPPGVNPETVRRNIKRAVPTVAVASAVEMVTTASQRQLHDRSRKVFYFGLMIWLVATLALGVIFSSGVDQKRKQVLPLGATGVSRGMVFKLVLYESFLLTTPGYVLGLILGGGILFYLRDYFYLIMDISPAWPTPFFLGVVLITLLAGAWLSGVLTGLYLAVRGSTTEPLGGLGSGD